MKALPLFSLLICCFLAGNLLAREVRGRPPKEDFVWKARAWTDFAVEGLPVVSRDFMLQTEALKIVNTDAAGKTVTLFDINNPGITRAQYQLEFGARGESIEKSAYFELQAHFADGSHITVKTQADSGPLQKLTGNSPPRTVWLPFSQNTGKRPTRLVLNVTFEGKGVVFAGRTTLTQSGEEIRLPVEPAALVNENEIWAAKPWTELAGRGKDAEVVSRDDALKGPALKLSGSLDGARTVQFLEVTAPPLTQSNYRFEFPIRYENVDKVAFIEMWTHFSDGGVYFSRTLADLGPMQKILGTSPPRTASVPFYNTSGKRPARLVFNLVFNGSGTVWLGQPRFVQFGDALPPETPRAANALKDAPRNPGEWWSEHAAGLVGGGTGALLGLCGTLVGLLTFLGKARRIVLALLAIMLGMGVLCLVTGVISLAASQPYHIFYPLLLIGAISTLLPLALYNTVRARYEDVELSRMEAMDA